MEDLELTRAVHEASNRALTRGALAGGVTAALATGAVAVLALTRPWLWLAMATVGGISLWFGGVWLLARRGRVVGAVAWVTMLGLHLVPLGSAMAAAALLPFGAATFHFGPISLVFLVAVVLSGLTFEPVLTRVSGVVGSVGLFVTHALAGRHLDSLSSVLERGFFHDLADPGIAALRSFVVLGVSLLVAAAASASRGLVKRVRDETKERQVLHGLFGQYVSDAVRDKLVREKAQVRGERKEVAVLFCDLRGFTTFSEGLAPAEVVARLNAYFERMVAAITRHGGTVDKFIGDAVMATFGGLLERERPCDDAFDAALAMRAALEELNVTFQAAGRPPVDNGIGVHFGEVLQGPIGSEARREFTVIGDTVNTASRLESATKELGAPVVFSEAAAARLTSDRRATLRELGAVKLKGKQHEVRVLGLGAPP